MNTRSKTVMKKTQMLLLALGLPLCLAGTALGAETAEIRFPSIPVNTVHAAGETYAYPLTDPQGVPLGEAVYEQYSFEASVYSGEEWVDSLEVRPGEGGGPVLELKTADAGGEALGVGRVRYRISCRSLESGLVVSTSLGKLTVRVDGQDVTGEEITLVALEIPVPNADFEETPFVSPAQSLVTFAKDLEEVKISFGDLASFQVPLGAKRSFRLYFEEQVPAAAEEAARRAGAETQGLCFTGRPVFEAQGELRFRTRYSYLYEVEADGSLRLLETVRDGEDLVVLTHRLGSYAASDLPLTET